MSVLSGVVWLYVVIWRRDGLQLTQTFAKKQWKTEWSTPKWFQAKIVMNKPW